MVSWRDVGEGIVKYLLSLNKRIAGVDIAIFLMYTVLYIFYFCIDIVVKKIPLPGNINSPHLCL